MAKPVVSTMNGIRKYLFQDKERNEDLVLSYFRSLFPESFQRQSDACMADGYVAGHFVLEIKGSRNDWLSALFQGLCYENKGLSFNLIIVVTNEFLGIWDKNIFQDSIREVVKNEKGAPSAVGKKLATKYKNKSKDFLSNALWLLPVSGDLFNANDKHFSEVIKSFEKSLISSKKKRIEITIKNFQTFLPQMKEFFDPQQPIKTVRAFYSLIYSWDSSSIVSLNPRSPDKANVTCGNVGIEITNLVPSKRDAFKTFVENHEIKIGRDENHDDFFSQYDVALDSVDREFRVKNGIFFTDLDLSKFVMWMVKQKVPNLGKNYIVVDPACGSGNLVTNWKSPLEIRHKVVSEIEPELLFAVEQRMKGDQWHDGKYTVIPKVSENKGLNFLDISAGEYLDTLKSYLKDKGIKPNKPIAFLCNPPYRSDDEQTAESISYPIDPNIISMIGNDAAAERYCCFISQMKLICEQAEDSGFPDESILMLFTKASWLTHRPTFKTLRREILSDFEDIGSIIVNGKEFFDLQGKFPIAFTMWRYKGKDAGLNADRPIKIIDLTWLKKIDLKSIDWKNFDEVDIRCREIFKDERSLRVAFRGEMFNIKDWSEQKMFDFKRGRRISEIGSKIASGLPLGDHRQLNKKAYGEPTGHFMGFMDNLTPCRVTKDTQMKPWFRLDNVFMNVRSMRCFSGPTDNRSYCASDLETAKKVFSWYFLGKLFAYKGYPMWVDALELWPVDLQNANGKQFLEMAFAFALAENECIDVIFPANNPVKGAVEIRSGNPLSPLNNDSFWSKTMKPLCDSSKNARVKEFLGPTYDLFLAWKKHVKKHGEIIVNYNEDYNIGNQVLSYSAGIQQIKDYAAANNVKDLLSHIDKVNQSLKAFKDYAYEFLLSPKGMNYFDPENKVDNILPFKVKTKTDIILEKRLHASAIVLDELKNDSELGLTKFAKLLYMYDVLNGEDLDMTYSRMARGPLDYPAMYGIDSGILNLGKRHGYFDLDRQSKQHEFITGKNFDHLLKNAKESNPDLVKRVKGLCKQLRDLTSTESEIVATIYACWNDLILDRKIIDQTSIENEFFKNWHIEKQKISKTIVISRFKWMNEIGFIPCGKVRRTIRNSNSVIS